MKIAFLTPTLEMHGGNVVLHTYVEHLASEGHEVHVITTDKPQAFTFSPSVTIHKLRHIPIRYLDFFLLQKPYLGKMVSFLEEISPDVVVPIYTPLLPAATHYKKSAPKARVIPLYQDTFKMVWAGIWIKKILQHKKTIQALNGVIVITQSGLEELASITNMQPVLIPNGINEAFFETTPAKKRHRVLFVGRPNVPKGFPQFKKVAEALAISHPNATCTVATPTSEDLSPIERVSLPEPALMAQCYGESLVYVSTSLAESFGLPALEAMAMGTPCVLTKTQGAAAYAVDEQNCLMTDVGDWEATLKAVQRILNDETLANMLRQNGLKTSSEYHWQTSLTKLSQYLTSEAN